MAVTFLSLVILSVPLAFDVGGRDCGLTYSLSLSIFYFMLSTARLVTPVSQRWKGARVLLETVGALQHVVIVPGLLIYALNKFSDDEGGKDGRGGGETWAEKITIVPWDGFLTFSTPVFQLCEGFCSLLVIQAVGQISRWLVNGKKSDTWVVRNLSSAFCDQYLYANPRLDCSFGHVELHYFLFRILPLEDNNLPRNWERRCYPYRSLGHVRNILVCIWYWIWKREPHRVLAFGKYSYCPCAFVEQSNNPIRGECSGTNYTLSLGFALLRI